MPGRNKFFSCLSRLVLLIYFGLIMAACGRSSEGENSIVTDKIAPASVTSFTATSSDQGIILSWVNPVDSDFSGVVIRRSTVSSPISPADGVSVYTGAGTSASDSSLTNGTTYYYSIFAYDEVPNYSTQITSVNAIYNKETIGSCRRTVENKFEPYWADFRNWRVIPYLADLELTNDYKKVTFDLSNTTGSRLFVERSVYLKKNSKYAFRLKVTEFSGNYSEVNFAVLGGDNTNFIGNRSVIFSQNGIYGMIFEYIGENSNYLLRLGIGTTNNDLPAYNDNNARFSIQDIMWETLNTEEIAPSEYVWPSNRWCFSHEKKNILNINSGLLLESKGVSYNEEYKTVWAITADSFGNDSTDFPKILLGITTNDYAFYTDAVPGRTVQSALNVFNELITVQNFPEGIAKPYGVVIQGGVNDIVGGATLHDLQNAVLVMLKISHVNDLKSIVLTISPFKGFQSWDKNKENIRVEYNDWLRSNITDNINAYLVDIAVPKSSGGLANDSDVELLDQEYNVGDGLHPNIIGSTVIAERIKFLLDNL